MPGGRPASKERWVLPLSLGTVDVTHGKSRINSLLICTAVFEAAMCFGAAPSSTCAYKQH
jgi:hypothetical protein